METFMMLLRNEDVVAFRNFTRLSPQMFLDLVEPLTPRPQGRHMVQRLAGGLTEGGHTTPAPRHEGQLQVFDVSFLCSSNPTTAEVWKKIAASYSSRWSFHHVIGALDGKPIHIRCPANGGSKFYNYKEYHSIVLHALVDANYRFTWVQVGALGEHLMPSCRMSRHCETQS